MITNDPRKVHLEDQHGNTVINRIYDHGSAYSMADSFGEFVPKRDPSLVDLTLVDGWASDEEWYQSRLRRKSNLGNISSAS